MEGGGKRCTNHAMTQKCPLKTNKIRGIAPTKNVLRLAVCLFRYTVRVLFDAVKIRMTKHLPIWTVQTLLQKEQNPGVLLLTHTNCPPSFFVTRYHECHTDIASRC